MDIITAADVAGYYVDSSSVYHGYLLTPSTSFAANTHCAGAQSRSGHLYTQLPC